MSISPITTTRPNRSTGPTLSRNWNRNSERIYDSLYLGTSFENPLRNAIQRITSTLTDEVQLSVSELISHYSVRTGASAKTSMDLLLAMQRAIQHRHPVEVVYFTASRGQETRR